MSVFINEHTKRKEERKEKLLTLDCGWLGTGNNKRRQDLVGFIEPIHTRICTHTHAYAHTHTHFWGEEVIVGKKGPPVHPPQQTESWLAPSAVPTGLS